MFQEQRISGRQLSRTLVHRKTRIAVSLGAHSLEAQERSGRSLMRILFGWPHVATAEMGWIDY
jgi:hypothetical protein